MKIGGKQQTLFMWNDLVHPLPTHGWRYAERGVSHKDGQGIDHKQNAGQQVDKVFSGEPPGSCEAPGVQVG